jgi:L-threonylcarbamoyladenylate synthase
VTGRLEHAAALAALREGEVVGVPTDTVYGLAASLAHPRSVAALFSLKRRPTDVALPVLVDDYAAIVSLGVTLDERARRLVEQYWPGPLTVIVPAPASLARLVRSSDDVVGLRLPNDATLLALLTESGPLAVTSANEHGEAPCTNADEVLTTFSGRDDFAGVLDDGSRQGSVSTVVDLSQATYQILRHGALSDEVIAAALS